MRSGPSSARSRSTATRGPRDARCGDCWDHVALDPEHRLVVSVVVGKRTEENARQLVHEFYERTDGRPINLMTSDEYPAYARGDRRGGRCRSRASRGGMATTGRRRSRRRGPDGIPTTRAPGYSEAPLRPVPRRGVCHASPCPPRPAPARRRRPASAGRHTGRPVGRRHRAGLSQGRRATLRAAQGPGVAHQGRPDHRRPVGARGPGRRGREAVRARRASCAATSRAPVTSCSSARSRRAT